ncbi:MAG: tetratricopeptide repeat protein [Phycisphaerales bacterium]
MPDFRPLARRSENRVRRGAGHRVVLALLGLLIAGGIVALILLPGPAGSEKSEAGGEASADSASGSPSGSGAAGDSASGQEDAATPPAPAPPPPAPMPDDRRSALATAEDPLAFVLADLPPVAEIAPASPPSLAPDLTAIFRMIEERRSGPARVRLRRMIDAADAGTLPRTDIGHAAFLFGMTYHREKLYTEAAPWFARAIGEWPAYAPSYYFAGWGSFYLGQLERSRDLFRRHLAWQPDAADSHFGLGLIDLELGDPEAAVDRFTRSLALQPAAPTTDAARRSRAKAHARMGDALAELDRLDEACGALTDAVTLWPDHHEAWARLARVERRRGDAEAATAAETQQQAALARINASGTPAGNSE